MYNNLSREQERRLGAAESESATAISDLVEIIQELDNTISDLHTDLSNAAEQIAELNAELRDAREAQS